MGVMDRVCHGADRQGPHHTAGETEAQRQGGAYQSGGVNGETCVSPVGWEASEGDADAGVSPSYLCVRLGQRPVSPL